jgi:hypothetical protein
MDSTLQQPGQHKNFDQLNDQGWRDLVDIGDVFVVSTHSICSGVLSLAILLLKLSQGFDVVQLVG